MDTTNYKIEMTIAKAINEILSELFHEEKYVGFVDIWPETDANSSTLEVGVRYQKIKNKNQKRSHKHSIRFELIKDQGVRKL